MDDLKYGTRDKRGNWSPSEPAKMVPLFVFPPRLIALLKWLPNYFFSYNVVFFLSALAWWYWVLPDVAVLQTLAWGWILKLFAVNVVAVFLFFGTFELRLYMQPGAGKPVQIGPPVAIGAQVQAVPFSEPECRLHVAVFRNRPADLDRDPGGNPLRVCQRIRAMADIC